MITDATSRGVTPGASFAYCFASVICSSGQVCRLCFSVSLSIAQANLGPTFTSPYSSRLSHSPTRWVVIHTIYLATRHSSSQSSSINSILHTPSGVRTRNPMPIYQKGAYITPPARLTRSISHPRLPLEKRVQTAKAHPRASLSPHMLYGGASKCLRRRLCTTPLAWFPSSPLHPPKKEHTPPSPKYEQIEGMMPELTRLRRPLPVTRKPPIPPTQKPA
jgi:hypothetical protein